MSIVLYALGAALIGWGGYLMLAGESYAAIDIAASLAGWGAFTIGLGAVVAALHRLTRAVAQGRSADADPAIKGRSKGLKNQKGKRSADKAGKPKVLPAFVPAASAEPAHFEPALQARRVTSEPSIKPVVAKAQVTSSPVTEAKAERALVARPQPAPVDAASDGERRGMRLGFKRPKLPRVDDQMFETPPVANAALGGGLGRRKTRDETLASRIEPITTPALAVTPLVMEPAEPEETASSQPRLGLDPSLTEKPDAAEGSNTPPAPDDSTERLITPIRRSVAEAPTVALPDHGVAATDALPAQETLEPVAPVEPAVTDNLAAPEETSAAEPAAIEAELEPSPIEDIAPEPDPAEPSAPGAPAATTSPRVAADPRVPDWLARARARRQARMHEEDAPPAAIAEPRFVGAAGEPEAPEPETSEPQTIEPETSSTEIPEAVTFETEAPSELEPEPVATEDHSEPEPEPEPELASEPAETPDRQVVSEGEHNGVLYRFYDDGSVEAASPHGVRRFASVDDLQRAVISARGPDYQGPDADIEAGLGTGPETGNEPHSDRDPLDAALDELEGRPAPEVRLDADDRHGPGERR